ncbi:MAG: hypothetical protein OEL76_19075, partial [Siculibacillus sp.]|nr:hypothetical protein [Siculibacillus sp.]
STSFGSDVVAGGGSGGAGMAAGTSFDTALPGYGGTATAGDMLLAGTPGAAGLRLDGATIVSGNGAPSFFGGGGRGSVGNGNGSTGTARGSGGSGAAVSSSATGRPGGAGAAGVVWIWEFE